MPARGAAHAGCTFDSSPRPICPSASIRTWLISPCLSASPPFAGSRLFDMCGRAHLPVVRSAMPRGPQTCAARVGSERRGHRWRSALSAELPNPVRVRLWCELPAAAGRPRGEIRKGLFRLALFTPCDDLAGSFWNVPRRIFADARSNPSTAMRCSSSACLSRGSATTNSSTSASKACGRQRLARRGHGPCRGQDDGTSPPTDGGF